MKTLVLHLLCWGALLKLCQSYPIIVEVDHNDSQCLDLNIPDGDDAHLFFLVLNDDISHEAEDWFVTEMVEISRHESKRFLGDIDYTSQPSAVRTNDKDTRYKSKVSATVELVDSHPPSSKHFNLEYFKLTKMMNIAETLSKVKGWDESRGQFELCFNVRGKHDAHILFETVKVSEYVEKMHKRHVLKKEHLTPLEEAFDNMIALAHDVVDEMRYMEKRELRMKQTTDSTNSRIKFFSYLSIVILLGVTYVQITYLKSYFKKKKIL